MKTERMRPAALALLVVFAAALITGGAKAVDLNAPLPVKVLDDTGWGVIQKIYELPKDTDQKTLPIKDIEVGGSTYACSDVIREEIAREDSKEYSEIFAVESKTNDEATIAALLPAEREVKTDDGYVGILKLDPASVLAESTGQTKSSRNVTLKREYPNQASMDIAGLPMTVTDGGREYTLIDVQWREDNSYNGDDYERGTRYIAAVTYQREAVSYSDKGFSVTATYSGVITRPKDALIRYTVIFTKVTVADDGALSKDGTTSGNGGDGQAVTGTGTSASGAGVTGAGSTSIEPGTQPIAEASSPNSGLMTVLGIVIAVVLIAVVGFVLIKTGHLHFGRIYEDTDTGGE